MYAYCISKTQTTRVSRKRVYGAVETQKQIVPSVSIQTRIQSICARRASETLSSSIVFYTSLNRCLYFFTKSALIFYLNHTRRAVDAPNYTSVYSIRLISVFTPFIPFVFTLGISDISIIICSLFTLRPLNRSYYTSYRFEFKP